MMGRRRGLSLLVNVAAGSRICRAMASPMPKRAAPPVKFKTTAASVDRAVDDPAGRSSAVAIPPDTVVARASSKTIWQPSTKVFVGQGFNIYQIRSPADTDDLEPYNPVAMAEMSPRSGLILSCMQGGEIKKVAEIGFRGSIGDSSLFPLPPTTCDDGEVKEGEKPFYPRLQLGIYPKKKYGWMSIIHRYSNRRCFDTTITFAMECIKSCNNRDLQLFPDPTEGLLFEGSISEEDEYINDLIMRLDIHYVRGPLLDLRERHQIYESDASWDSSDVHLKRILGNSVDEPIESLIGKSLSHRSILRVHSSFRESASEVYIAHDTCERTLPEYLAVTQFVVKDRLWKCVHIAEAVKAGNEVHLVNPFINVNEILVTKEGEVKIANYGKAVKKQMGRMIGPIYGNGGTGSYCAPELRKRRPFDGKAEVFAIAKVFFRILIDTKDTDKATEELNRLVNLEGWKTNKVKLWRKSRLWKYFKCKEDLLLSMLDDDPDKRPNISRVIEELLAELDLVDSDEEEEGAGPPPE